MPDTIIRYVDFETPVSVDPIFYKQAAVSDGAWMAEGRVVTILPCDQRHRDAGKIGSDFFEEVFIIAVDQSGGSVTRFVKGIVCRQPIGSSELVMESECFWTSPQPFAILVKQMLRRPGDLHRTCVLRIYWAKQMHKGGEVERFISIPDLPVVIGLDPLNKEQRWVNLVDLAKAVGLEEPRAITAGFLAHDVFGSDSLQPAFVFAQNAEALKTGPMILFPGVKLVAAAQQTLPLDTGCDDNEDVSPENVWVAEASALKIQRIAALGIRFSSDLVPPRSA